MPSFYSRLPTFIGGAQPDAPRVFFPPLSSAVAALADLAAIADRYPVTGYGLVLADSAAAADAVYSGSASAADSAATSDLYALPGSGAALSDAAVSSDSRLSTGFTAAGSIGERVYGNDNLLLAFSLSPFSAEFSAEFGAGGTVASPFSAEFSAEFGAGGTAASLAATYVDIAAASDAAAVTAAVRLIADSAVSSDLFTPTGLSAVLPTSTVVTTDSYVFGVIAYTASLTDSAVTAGVVAQVSFYAALADSIGGGESLASSLSISYDPFTIDFSIDFGSGGQPPGTQTLNDAPATGDLFAAVTGIALSGTADSAAGTDAYAYPVAAALSETMAGGETLSGALAAAAALADFPAAGDAFSGNPSLPGAILSDAAVSGDSTGQVFGFTAALSDAAAATDSRSAAQAYGFALDDGAVSGDSTAAVFFIAGTALTDTAVSVAVPVIAATATGLSETVATADALAVTADTARSLTDAAATGDSTIAAPVTAGIADAAAVTESLAGALAITAFALSDGITAADAVAIAVSGGIQNSLAELSAATADQFTAAALAAPAGLSDLAVCNETLTLGNGVIAVGFGDAATETDSLLLTVVPGGITALTDQAVTGDLFGIALLLFILGDSAASSDSRGAAFGYGAALAEAAAGSDSLSAAAVNGAGLADSAATVDAVAFAASATTAVLADSAAAADAYVSANYLGALTDAAASGDTLAGVLAGVAAVAAGALAASDSLLLTAGSNGIFDNAVSADGLTGNAAAGSGTTDTAAAAAAPSVVLGWVVPVFGDAAVSSEILTTAPLSLLVPLSDNANTGDAVTPAGIARAAVIADAAVAADSVAVTDLTAALADTAASGDAAAATAASASVADTAAGADALTAVFGGAASLALADFAEALDGLAVPAAALSLTDTAATAEILAAVAGLSPPGLTDSAAASDSYGAAKGFPAVLADILTDSDSVGNFGFGYLLGLSDRLGGSDAWLDQGLSTVASATAMIIPTGGAVLLQFPGYFPPPLTPVTLTIERSVQGGTTWVLLYQGPPVGVFLDVGDSLPQPLDGTTPYIWRIRDTTGSAILGPLMPASSFINAPDQLTQVLIRALQGAINTLVLPPGMQLATVTLKMPQNGWQAMPFIVVNLDLIQQTETEIGEDFPNPNPANAWTLFANARRVWRITVISQAAEERDFYRDSLLAAFRVLRATAFAPLGFDVSHTFSAASYSSSAEWEGLTPGFYGADLMLEVNGIFPAAVLTNYPVILEVASNPIFDPNTFIEQVL